jgi:hypothetical protein
MKLRNRFGPVDFGGNEDSERRAFRVVRTEVLPFPMLVEIAVRWRLWIN